MPVKPSKRCVQQFKQFDSFAETVKLNYDGGADTYKRIEGSIWTLILYSFLLWYFIITLINVI